MYPTVLINTYAALKEKLLMTMNEKDATQLFGKNLRSNAVNISLSLNFFLYYVTARGQQEKTNYKVKTSVLFQFIDYCYFNLSDYDLGYGSALSAIKCGANEKGKAFLYSLMTAPDRTPLSLGSEFTHTSFLKTAQALLEEAPASKRALYRSITESNLKQHQKIYTERLQAEKIGYLKVANSRMNKNFLSDTSSLDVTYSEDDSVYSEDSDVNPFVGPRSQRPIDPLPTNNNNNNIVDVSFDDEADVSDFLPPTDISTLQNTSLDEAEIHPHLANSLNNDPMLTSLLDNEPGDSNTSRLTQYDLSQAESTVLNESVTNVVRQHHMKRANDYSAEQFNDSFLKSLGREEARYNARKRRGMSYTGNTEFFDLRNESKDIRRIQSKPAKAFTNQDDDYLDYAFYGYIREAGTVINDIMILPNGFEYNSERRGDSVYIRAIHFRNTFTHITGSKASGRMVLFASDKEYSSPSIFGGRSFNNIEPHDVLQKSVTMYAGDLEEAEAIDAFYNPTIMSQYDFRNIILGSKFEVLYDYYADLNTQAVKGVVGEDIESVDSVKTKWVKIDDLDIPLYYEGNNKVPTRGILGIVFMGDYFGGEIETNLTLRVFYNSK